MGLLDLVAVLAIPVELALAVALLRRGRALGRITHRLSEEGEGALEPAPYRVAELQARRRVSQGLPDYERRKRIVAIGVVVVVLVLVAGVGWLIGSRDDSPDSAAAPAALTSELAGSGTPHPSPS